ncbi:TPA: MFS transporter, partial [Klebsiella pneumoniae]
MPIRENNPESLVSVQSTNWSAVLSVMLGVAGMITSELLPVSLLTPMASGLKITEGMAGQSVSLTALVAIFSSLFITTLTRGINRRWVVAGFSLILALANF